MDEAKQLPAPWLKAEFGRQALYTADQMQAYGDARVAAALAAHQPSAAEPVALRQAALLDDVAMDEVLDALHNEAMGYNPSDYGLPIHDDDTLKSMRAIVRKYAAAAPPVAVPVGWIGVDERLPTPFEDVWVHPAPADYCMVAAVDTKGLWRYREHDSWGVQHCETSCVTHWMPIPVAPAAARGDAAEGV